MIPKIKICGMKHNTLDVAALQPDYLGFIFYANSSRAFSNDIPDLAPSIQKVGVFVDATIDTIINHIDEYGLNIIQLHGEESARFCEALRDQLKGSKIEIWKVFAVGVAFDFAQLTPFEPLVNKYLFDAKGENKGGNGYRFDWELLQNYPTSKPFIISGGIGSEHIDDIKKMMASGLPIYGIDLNSKFEQAPGLKDIHALKIFQHELSR